MACQLGSFLVAFPEVISSLAFLLPSEVLQVGAGAWSLCVPLYLGPRPIPDSCPVALAL